jgi:cyclopropane fatty-acyl-phospholipid synthase-like methyltransferase
VATVRKRESERQADTAQTYYGDAACHAEKVSVETALTCAPVPSGLALRDRITGDVNIRAAAQQREYAAVVERIAADRPQKILDWGCGWGHISHALLERGFDVSSTDYAPDQPGRKRSDHFPDVEVDVMADPVALPFEDETFDAALSLGVLEHVGDPAASLDELHRVLRPGGTLYVYKLPNRYSWLEWVARRIGMDYHGMRPEDTLYTVHSAVTLVEAHGYTVDSARRANMLPLLLPGKLANRLSGIWWALNRVLARVPGLNLLATNVELIATRR